MYPSIVLHSWSSGSSTVNLLISTVTYLDKAYDKKKDMYNIFLPRCSSRIKGNILLSMFCYCCCCCCCCLLSVWNFRLMDASTRSIWKRVNNSTSFIPTPPQPSQRCHGHLQVNLDSAQLDIYCLKLWHEEANLEINGLKFMWKFLHDDISYWWHYLW